MIRVVYNREAHRLTVRGHAESGAHGHDLVCAAVSILVFTLAQLLSEMEEKNYITEPVVKLEEGDAELSCKGELTHSLKLVFDTICTGFQLLAAQYPENVVLSVVEG